MKRKVLFSRKLRAKFVLLKFQLRVSTLSSDHTLVRVLRRNKICRIYRDFYLGLYYRNGSCGFGIQEVLKSALYRLENQESCRSNSGQIQKPENHGANSINPDLSLKAQESGVLMSKDREDSCLSSSREQIYSSSTFWFYLDAQQNG